MESAPTGTQPAAPASIGAALGIPGTVSPGDVGVGANSGGAVADEQRRKWREKGRLARARKKAAAGGVGTVAGGGETLAASAPAEGSSGAGAGAPAPIPWNPARLRDFWAQIVPMAEAEDIEDLCEKAEAVDPCLVDITRAEAPWNKLSKATLIETGPNVTADILNAAGIGAERADLVAFVFASVAIWRGRAKVARKLEKMLKDKLEREKMQKGRGDEEQRGDEEMKAA